VELLARRFSMRRLVLSSTMVAVSAAALICSSALGASADPFTGAWTAIDTDGSTLRLQIGDANAAGVRHVTLFDDFATGCGGGSATAIGSGAALGNTLEADVLVRCHSTNTTFPSTISIEAVDGTLISGVVFVRVGT
jgi:hypothetical protein